MTIFISKAIHYSMQGERMHAMHIKTSQWLGTIIAHRVSIHSHFPFSPMRPSCNLSLHFMAIK